MSEGIQVESVSIRPMGLWAALRAYEKAAGLGGDVQDSFVVNALRTMAYEPFEEMALHPEGWIKLNAGLDINVRLTSDAKLALDVSPWAERTHPFPGYWRFDDFAVFPGQQTLKSKPTHTVFELELEELASGLRDPDMQMDPDQALRRRIVFSCYEFLLQRLARHFDCRVQTALVCVGDLAHLMIRRTVTPDNPVEQANLLTGDHGVRWHSQYLALCKQLSVSPDELFAFFRKTLATLNGEGRYEALREYLGKPRDSFSRRPFADGTRALLGALNVVADPETYPPLVNHPSEKLDKVFRDLLQAKNWRRGADTIAERYHMDEVEIHSLLREHYPSVLLCAPGSLSDVMRELEHFVDERTDVPAVTSGLAKHLDEALRNAWQKLSSPVPGTRRRQLARTCSFQEFDGLKAWVQKYCPPAISWLEELERLKGRV